MLRLLIYNISKWLMKVCKENNWFHTKSPIIWREVAMTKGKKYLVGDITRFLDLCQDHYGLKREMLRGELFHKLEIEWFANRSAEDYMEDIRKKAEEHLAYRCRQVCILGAACHACDILVMELLHIPLQNRENGLEIRLYDEPHREKKLKAIAEDAKHSLGYSGLGSCRVAANMKEALYNVDLVIVLDSFPRKLNESLVKWLKRNRNAMCILGNALNKYARTHCRVIIGSPSNQPVCYNATVLASFATKLHVRNIVVVTQDLGRETLVHLAKKKGLNLNELNCPPVWGFVGLSKYIDLRNTLQTYKYKVPGPRISKNLSQGSEELEIRTIDPFLEREDINSIAVSVMAHKETSEPQLGRSSQLAKITAILDLLKVWGLKQEDGNGEILSLGVYSDGTFNIPEGIFWSQPVTLEKGFWKPFGRYPIPRRLDINIQSFFTLGVASLAKTNVPVRKQRDPKPVCKKKESNKFDMNKLSDGMKLPVVRTKADCLELLKRLIEELGIGAGEQKSLSTITEASEESSIEAVPQEKIYCECWRQEILQLRKMATDISSGTEVEVDLSENLSGSEWSVMNPPDSYLMSEDSSVGKPAAETYSSCAVCDCGAECHCLSHGDASNLKTGENMEEESTEHFYKRQDARVYDQQDVKETIYEDMYKKEVKFDESLEPCADKPKKKYKFYGTKDAIVDEEKRQAMLKRIRRYEEGGGDEEIGEGEEASSSADSGQCILITQKFHVSIDENYEIVGDHEGLEALEEMRRSGQREPADDFTEMWADEVTPTLHVLTTDSDSTSSSMGKSQQTEVSVEKVITPEEDYGEGGRNETYRDDSRFKSILEVIPEAETEEEVESVDEVRELKIMVDEVPLVEDVKQPEIIKTRKWEGIPKCCLCHCIVPEGELGCHCGETRVMEVFKQESEEVESVRSLIRTSSAETEREERGEEEEEGEEEDQNKKKKVKERVKLKDTDEEMKGLAVDEEEEEEEEEKAPERKRRNIDSLPPETFFPFSPKPVNKFLPSETPRPKEEDTENILDYLSPECLQMLEEAKANIPEIIQREDEERSKKFHGKDDLVFELEEANVMLDISGPRQYRVENWTKILKMKYKEWFETAKRVPDDFYYSRAGEEPSDEECEVDKELSKFFED